MKKLFLSLLFGVIVAYSATAQTKPAMSPEYEQEFRNTIERISQRLKEYMIKLEAGDSTFLVKVASMEASMAFVYVQDQNYESALQWIYRCIERNAPMSNSSCDEDIARVYTMMGLFYAYGLAGIEKDDLKAFEWYQKGADRGDPQAMFEVGLVYQKGDVVEVNKRKAFEWWLISAQQDGIEACRNVAIGYYFGNGVKRDYVQSVRWAEKGMDMGDAYCTFMLGVSYYKGKGVERDYEKAFEWFNLSAKQGEPSANQAIAECYYYGRGVEKDYQMAKEWCQRGVELEDEEAVKFMKKLKNK